MGDDIDDLLNEVETKYCCSGKTEQPKYRHKRDIKFGRHAAATGQTNAGSSSETEQVTKKSAKLKCTTSPSDTDLNDILNEILDPEDDIKEENRCKVPSNASSSLKSISSTARKKCLPVYLGGTACSQGLGSTVQKRTCDSLRCTDCDFRVSTFDNRQWHSSTDYLFLRNNMPDTDKVASKLRTKKGVRAYACQCKWRNVQQIEDLGSQTDLNWVCGRH